MFQSVSKILSTTGQAIKNAGTLFGKKVINEPISEQIEQNSTAPKNAHSIDNNRASAGIKRQNHTLSESTSFTNKSRTRNESYSSWQMGRYEANIHDSVVDFLVSQRDIEGKTLNSSRTNLITVNAFDAFRTSQLNLAILNRYKTTEEEKIARREAFSELDKQEEQPEKSENDASAAPFEYFEPIDDSTTSMSAQAIDEAIAATAELLGWDDRSAR